jgi:hypothetical protein
MEAEGTAWPLLKTVQVQQCFQMQRRRGISLFVCRDIELDGGHVLLTGSKAVNGNCVTSCLLMSSGAAFFENHIGTCEENER